MKYLSSLNQCKHRNRSEFHTLIVTFLFFLFLGGCGDSASSRLDICNDRSWDECGHIAKNKCGLSSTATDAQLERCDAYMRCEDASFEACMTE